MFSIKKYTAFDTPNGFDLMSSLNQTSGAYQVPENAFP